MKPTLVRQLMLAYGLTVGILGAQAGHAATLPTPCIAGSCVVKGGPAGWVTSGSATATITGATLQVKQSSGNAILNWSNFDVSADGHVVFKQPNGNSIALNRIFEGSPSAIFGSITANGQLYLVNQNGFVFGATSSVNVGGLVASSLGISDATLNAGLLSPIANALPALTYTRGPDGQPLASAITVQPGAVISTAAPGQRILLAAPTITNGGSISAPDGQAILASGQSVFLYASTDPKLRGLLVEVDGGGTTTNQATGSVSADRGNVTLIGLAVNQNGRVSATTSTAANGSVRLLARDSTSSGVSVVPNTSTPQFATQPGGTLEFGPQSVTSVLPDPTDHSTVVDAQAQLPSTIELSGLHVAMAGGSKINSPNGQLTITAAADLASPLLSSAGSNPSIRMDSGASIDLAGSDATVPVTRNLVTVELRGTELADSPVQRNGPLRGQTVIVDARADNGKGTPLANVSGEIALTQRDIYERTDQGGTVVFNSTGDIGIANGATIDVSGGAVNYTGGIMQTSNLVKPDGTLVNIAQADPNQPYAGVVTPAIKTISNKWGVISFIPSPALAYYEPGYVQGASAGKVQFVAPTMILDGNFVGTAVNGPFQRSGVGIASGGTFIVGAPTGTTLDPINFVAPTVQFASAIPNIVFDDSAPLPSSLPLILPTNFITSGGFTQVQVASNSRITIPESTPITIAPGGSLNLIAPRIDVLSSVSAPGGSISASATLSASPSPGLAAGLFVGNGVSLDASGQWINETLLPQGVVPAGLAVVNGGNIALEQTVFGGTLSIGSAVQVHANGGGWFQQSGSLTAGKGGSIALGSNAVNANGDGTIQVADGFNVEAFGVQGAAGGSFSLEAPRIAVSSGSSAWLGAQTVMGDPASNTVLAIDSSLFTDFGFARFALIADGAPLARAAGAGTAAGGNVLTVASGSTIDLSTRTLQVNPNASSQPTGSAVLNFAQPTLLPEFQRTASSLTLTAIPATPQSYAQVGNILIGAGTKFVGPAKSSLALSTVGSIEFDGLVDLPGGSVGMSIVTPPTIIDPGFVSGQRIELGSTAAINVSGTAVYTPNNAGLLQGTLYAGGSVSLTAQRGSVITDAGSLIDFSGTQAPFDFPGSQGAGGSPRTILASAGGSLFLAAPESLSLLGSFSGHGGVGTLGGAFGGSLGVELTRQSILFTDSGLVFPSAPRVIELTSATPVLEPDTSGLALLNTSRIAASGIDSLTLFADGRIEFDAGVKLALGRSLILQSPTLSVGDGTSVSVAAPYVALGTQTTAQTGNLAPGAALPGPGSLQIHGGQVDITGFLSFQGVATASIESTGDIGLRGNEANGLTNIGGLTVAGDLTLTAERVVPSTAAQFTITDINPVAGAPGYTVRFAQAGASPGTPLSVDGSIRVNADNIIQAGTILAPFGTISLNVNATNGSLTLAGGSTTSVSGNSALLPYGIVENGTTWEYGLIPQLLVPLKGIPNRQITLSGAAVTLAKGATVNVSGGGDISGYQWTPGTGGTTDALANGSIPGLYAVIPSLSNTFGPYDPLVYQGSNLQPGQSVYLSGGSGLAAGVYALLPARYALLPGAYLVQAISGYGNLRPGAAAATPDGAPIVAGYLTFAGTSLGAGAGYSGFSIRPGSYGDTLANYTNYAASVFFPNQAQTSSVPSGTPPNIPADAGTLSISVDQTLLALGTVLAGAAPGGQNATVAIAAPQIEIDPNANQAQSAGDVHLSAGVITAWHAGRLILGGSQTAPDVIQVESNSVHVTSGSTLVADEIVMVAGQGISVDGGASVESTSAASGTAASAGRLANSTSLSLIGNGAGGSGASGAALLAVSDLDYYQVARTTETATAPGTLTISSGATVGSLGALTIDVPGTTMIADGSVSGTGARWSLGSGQVVFGPASTQMRVLTVDASLVAALNAASSVDIRSATSIDFEQAVNLTSSRGSTAPLQEISLLAPVLNNFGGAAASSFSANKIRLGSDGAATASPIQGAGSLTFSANEIDVGSGTLALSGFSQTALTANSALVGMGTGGLTASGNLDVRSNLITTQAGATTVLSAANGALHLQSAPASASASGSALVPGIGGSLTASGQTIVDEASILMPSGAVNFTAATQLTLQSSASINVAGIVPAVALGTHGSPGGSIALRSSGALSVSSDSQLTVSGALGADAGVINVSAAGAANLAGSLSGTGAPSFAGGSFALVAGSLADFNSLNQRLEQGGFTTARIYRVNTGDLDLATGSTITAQQVGLAADTGSVVINGTIKATNNAGRGLIELSAGRDVLVAGQLIANAGDAASRGGSIQLSSVAGQVNLAAGSTVAASGINATGQLLIRAPGSATGTDINLTISTGLSKVDSVVIEPVWSEALPNGTPAQTDIAAIMGDAANFMAAVSPNLIARIPQLTASNVALRPFVDITAPGDLQLPSLNFGVFRFSGQPADVEFRAAGNLTVNGTVSDGFKAVTYKTGIKTSASYLDLATCPSGSICPSTSFTLVAGADFTSADTAATTAGAAADLAFGGGSILRTGTGDLTLAAARDIIVGDTNAGIGASVYTGGSQAAPTAVTKLLRPTVDLPTSYGAGDSRITLTAGRDVTGVPVSQSVSGWQPRSTYTPSDPTVAASASWGFNFGDFGWSVGALGGGDLVIQAGRNANNVSAAVADSNYIDGAGAAHPFGGGNLSLSAGADVGSAYLYVAAGNGRVDAGGSINSARSDPTTNTLLGTQLMAGNASFSLSARGDILLQGINQASNLSAPGRVLESTSDYFRYGPNSALNLSSVGGSITVNGDSGLGNFVGPGVSDTLVSSDIISPIVNLSAYAGDVNFNGLYTLFPAARGQLSVVASNDVVGNFASIITMADVEPSTLPAPGALLGSNQFANALLTLGLLQSTSVSAIHAGDSTQALISAGHDIVNLSLALAKPATLSAGRNISGLVYNGQNLAATDVTLITAGRNINYTSDPTSPDFNTSAHISIGGPGELELLAGGNIDLGFSQGVTTLGNLANPNLAPQGANVLMLAGQGAPLGVAKAGAANPNDFVSNIIGASSAYQSQLETYVGQLTDQTSLSFDAAARDLRGLPEAQQLPLLANVFFNELTLSGREANTNPTLGFSRGYAAIDSLFPASRGTSSPYTGDLTLNLSRIYTLQGGSVSLLVPGGGVDVGLAILPPDITQLGLVRTAADLGIVAIQSGDVQIYALDNVLVNSSRVFTEGGGNIIIWSTAGNIDAGQGAKTSVSAPPPLALVSASGTVTLDFSNTITGSGIRTISTGTDITPGNVDLDAPVGFVNAGDAGIGSAGNLNIAAQRVLGVDNIQVGGTATGVPPATSGIGAALSGASSAGSSTTSAATSSVADANSNARQTAPLADTAIGWLDVFVEGLGEENCKPSDMECLKRQKR